jgi:hypothetical protein
MKKSGIIAAALIAMAQIGEIGAMPDETVIRQAGKDRITPSTLNGKQKAERKAKNKAAKAARKRNR